MLSEKSQQPSIKAVEAATTSEDAVFVGTPENQKPVQPLPCETGLEVCSNRPTKRSREEEEEEEEKSENTSKQPAGTERSPEPKRKRMLESNSSTAQEDGTLIANDGEGTAGDRKRVREESEPFNESSKALRLDSTFSEVRYTPFNDYGTTDYCIVCCFIAVVCH